MVPTIERVLDEFDRVGLFVSINRIDLDIGTIPAARLELAAERLEVALSDALIRALGGSGGAGVDATRPNALNVVPAGAAQLDLLEQYLLYGIWLYRPRDDSHGDPAALLSGAIDSQPAALVQLIRHHSSRPEFVERLGRQMPFAVLERLLHLLEPERATAILTFMRDPPQIHRLGAITPLSDASFTRMLWPLVLRHVLTETGALLDARILQRRLLTRAVDIPTTGRAGLAFSVRGASGDRDVETTSFHPPVRQQLESGEGAGRSGARELALTAASTAAFSVREPDDGPVEATGPSSDLTGELPSRQAFRQPDTREIAPAAATASPPIDLFEQFLLRGSWQGTKPEALMLLLADEDPDELARLFRRHSWNDAMLRRVTEVMSTAALGRLLTVLEPEAAAPILVYMIDMRELHRSEPIVPLSDAALGRLLWNIALRYVLREMGTQFNRRSFIAALIEDVAIEEGLTYREVLTALRLGVREMAKANPVATSLPMIINDLADELQPAEFHAAALSRLARLLEEGEQIPAAELRRIIETAREQDSRGLRSLLRWYAGRRPARFVHTLGAALSTPALIRLMLHGEAAREVLALTLRLAALPVTQAVPAHSLDIAVLAAIAPDDGAPADGPRLFARTVRSVAEVLDVPPARLAALLAANGGGETSLPELDRPEGAVAWNQPTRASDTQDFAREAEEVATAYARLDQFRHFLRTGELPWRDILTEPAMTPRQLVAFLEHVRPSLVRAALVGTRSHQSILRRAVGRLNEAEVARVIGWLLPDGVAGRQLRAAVADYARKAPDPRTFQSEVIAALIEGRSLDLEAVAAIAAETHAAPTDFDTIDNLLSVLAEGIGQHSAASANWKELLIRLAMHDRRAARRFLTAVTARPGGLGRLAERFAPPPLLQCLLAALVPAATSILTALGQSLAAYGTRRGSGPARQAITEAILAEALSIEPDAIPGFALVARLLHRLFGDTLPPSLRRNLLPGLPRAMAAAVAAAIEQAAVMHRREPPRHSSRQIDPQGRTYDVEPASGSPTVADLGKVPATPHARRLDDVVLRKRDRAQADPPIHVKSDGSPLIDGQSDAASVHPPTSDLVNERLDEWLRAWQFGDADGRAESEGAHTEWLFRALSDRDLSRASPGTEVPELLSELLSQLLETPRAELAIRLIEFLHQSRNRADLIRLLPERLLARLIMYAVPHIGRDLLDAGELLTEAAGAAGSPLDRAALWQALFATAAAPHGERTVAGLAEQVFAMVGRVSDGASTKQRDAPAEALLHAVVQRARDAGHAALVAALTDRRGKLVASYAGRRHGAAARPQPVTARAKSQMRPIRTRSAFRLRGDDDDVLKGEPIYIGNAGLVLTNPFLPQLFDVLGLLVRGEDGKPRLRGEAASRGVHLLQYLVDGRADRPEPLLALNKLLCGQPVATPVEREIEATEAERDTCDTLLRSMIESWPIVRGTSIAGLRETFLQREGKLTLGEGGWRLQVQRKTLDVLLDQVPWSIGVVFHPWMPGPLHVTW